jgi:hypothetical protein
MRLPPPTNISASIKKGPYILRLSQLTVYKSRVAHVALFDQAFVQAVCSLALLAGAADDTLIRRCWRLRAKIRFADVSGFSFETPERPPPRPAEPSKHLSSCSSLT